jgi:hypothetical protein
MAVCASLSFAGAAARPQAAPSKADVTKRAVGLLDDAQREAARLLASRDVAAIGWGAYLASERGFRDLADDLRRAIERVCDDAPPAADRDEEALRTASLSALLDGAIRLHVQLDASLLKRCLDHPGHEFVREMAWVLFASAKPGGEEALLGALEVAPETARWKLVCNRLIEKAPRLFVREAIRRFRLHLTVEVTDLGESRSTELGDGFVDCRIRWPAGMPPLISHRIHDVPVVGSVCISRGPSAVFDTREVLGWGGKDPIDASMTGRRIASRGVKDDAYSLTCLAKLAHCDPADLPMKAADTFSENWSTADELRAAVASRVATQRAAWRDLIDLLVHSDLADAKELAATPLAIDLELLDLRSSRRETLPEIDLSGG